MIYMKLIIILLGIKSSGRVLGVNWFESAFQFSPTYQFKRLAGQPPANWLTDDFSFRLAVNWMHSPTQTACVPGGYLLFHLRWELQN